MSCRCSAPVFIDYVSELFLTTFAEVAASYEASDSTRYRAFRVFVRCRAFVSGIFICVMLVLLVFETLNIRLVPVADAAGFRLFWLD